MIKGGGGGRFFSEPETWESNLIFCVFEAQPHSGRNFSSCMCVEVCLPESEPEYCFSSGCGPRFLFRFKTRAEKFFSRKSTPGSFNGRFLSRQYFSDPHRVVQTVQAHTALTLEGFFKKGKLTVRPRECNKCFGVIIHVQLYMIGGRGDRGCGLFPPKKVSAVECFRANEKIFGSYIYICTKIAGENPLELG